jgi:type I restriction enzyme S subunit
MTSEWKRVTVSEVCELIVDCVNKTAPVVEEPTPYKMLRTTNIKGGRIDREECRRVSKDTFVKWTRRADVRRGDVILTREAPLGEVGYVDFADTVFLGQRLMQYRANPALLEPRFLLYSFLSKDLQNQFGAHEGSGSTVSHIRVGDCSKFELSLPPLSTQRAIASVLGALDDKIEVNRRMNATLEAMARALFQSWFVDFDPVRAKLDGRHPEGMDAETAALFPAEFEEGALGPIPKGWCAGGIADIAANPRRSIQPSQIASNTPYIALEHMPRRCIALGDWDESADVASGKSAFKRGEILFGKLRPYFHKVGVAPFDGVCSTDILVVAPKSPEWFGFLLGHLSSDELIQFTDLASTGTKMPRTNWSDISSFKVALPPKPIAATFKRSIQLMLDRIHANLHESRTLAPLRDTVLPKLLSGELRVGELEN